MNDFYYRKLDSYQLAKQLVKMVYQLLRSFPEYERYALSDQMRRAAISIPSNIAEGTGRFSIKDRIRFLDIAYGSLCETMCQMEIAHEQLYLSEEDYISFENLASRTSMTMMGLKRNYDNKLNSSTND